MLEVVDAKVKIDLTPRYFSYNILNCTYRITLFVIFYDRHIDDVIVLCPKMNENLQMSNGQD